MNDIQWLEQMRDDLLNIPPDRPQSPNRVAALSHAIAAMKARSDSVVCPFCQEDGFDLIGLKHHLLSCEEMAKTEAINFIRTRPAAKMGETKS